MLINNIYRSSISFYFNIIDLYVFIQYEHRKKNCQIHNNNFVLALINVLIFFIKKSQKELRNDFTFTEILNSYQYNQQCKLVER